MYRRSKYRNKKTVVDGITFDSLKEAQRFKELQLLERAGEITELAIQVPFELIPKQIKANGEAERSVTYIADFTYWENGKFVVEDTKGFRTDTYKIKRKLMLKQHGITIKEV